MDKIGLQSLADLLTKLPAISDPNIQSKLSSRLDVNSYKAKPGDPPPENGDYFKHQKFMHYLMQNYNEVAIIDPTGTGKTCEVTGAAEAIYDAVLRNREENTGEKNSGFKKTIIVTKGGPQINDVYYQIACKCSKGRYLEKVKPSADPKKDRKKQAKLVKQNINKWYTITTAEKLYNKINKFKDELEANKSDPELLYREYDNTIFWFDEAHDLIPEGGVEGDSLYAKIYRTLFDVLHHAKNIKIFLTTATPIVNYVALFIPLMNLILPLPGNLPAKFNSHLTTKNDLRVLFPKFKGGLDKFKQTKNKDIAKYYEPQMPANMDLDNSSIDDIEPYLRGRISYARDLENHDILVVESGSKQNQVIFDYDKGTEYHSQLIVKALLMSDFQTKAYINATKHGQKNMRGIRINEKQASNLAWPDGHWGSDLNREEYIRRKEEREKTKRAKEISKGANVAPFIPQASTNTGPSKGYNRYININDRGFPEATSEFKQALGARKNVDIDVIMLNLLKYSVKMSAAVDICTDQDRGIVFIYIEYLVGSGANSIAAVLELLGFERFDEDKSIFESKVENVTREYCTGSNEDEYRNRKIRDDFVEKPRYAVLTGEKRKGKGNKDKEAIMMEALKSMENRYGKLIKVIITTKIGRQGISIMNVTDGIIFSSEWNPSTLLQARGRFIRALSHRDLIMDKKTNEPIVVRIHQLCAITNTEDYISNDMYLYRLAENKDRSIRRLLQMLYEISISCHVNRARNIRASDKDYSAACNYTKCQYVCSTPEPEIDYNSYNIAYMDEEINKIISNIKLFFMSIKHLTLSKLSAEFPEEKYDKKSYLVGIALERIIYDRVVITDRYGFQCYMVEDNNIFFLVREFTGTNDNYIFADAYYHSNLIAVKNTNLSNIYESIEKENVKKVIEDSEDVDWDSATIYEKINAFEEASQDKFINKSDRDYTNVIDRFKIYWLGLHKPEQAIEAYNKSKNTIARGRKPGENPTLNAIKVRHKYKVNKTLPMVYLHNMNSLINQNTGKYANVSSYNNVVKFRILDTKFDKKWRDPTKDEISIYRPFLYWYIDDTYKSYADKSNGVFGIKLLDGILRLKRVVEIDDNSNKKNIPRGQDCSTINATQIIGFLYDLGYKLKISKHIREDPVETFNDKTGDKYKDWSKKKMMFYLQWAEKKGVNKKDTNMCYKLEKYLRKNDLLME